MIRENLKTEYKYIAKNFKHMIYKSYIINHESHAKHSLKYKHEPVFIYSSHNLKKFPRLRLYHLLQKSVHNTGEDLMYNDRKM